MSTYKATKLETKMRGLLLLLVGLFFACFSLYLSLTTGSQFTPVTAILVPLLLCLLMDAAYSFLKNDIFRSENWEHRSARETGEAAWKQLNIYFLIKEILHNIKGFIVILIMAGGAIYFFTRSHQTLNLNLEFYIQLSTYAIYLLILRRLLVPIMGHLKKFSQKFMTTYSVDENGVTFTLPDKDLSHPERKFTIHVDFREIEEAKLLSYQEAKSYMKYEFSSDPKKLSSAPKNWMLFLKENVRPSIYTRVVSGGASVLLQGKENFYLITVNNDDPRDILEYYERSKRS